MKICDNIIISDGITVTATNLLIDIPEDVFRNGDKRCLVVAQAIPDTATINLPVGITIGGDATTIYPMVTCDCSAVTASMIRSRNKYIVKVVTNSTGASFKVLSCLSSAPSNDLASIPTA